MTSKGQITLPAPLRDRLGLRPGVVLAIREVEGHIEVELPTSIEEIRERIKAEAQAAGTWGTRFDVSDGWAKAAGDRIAVPDNA